MSSSRDSGGVNRGKQGKQTQQRARRPQDAVPKVDEKTVRETDRTVPVEPVKQSEKAKQPMPEPALDHRRQIVGTDEPTNPRRER